MGVAAFAVTGAVLGDVAQHVRLFQLGYLAASIGHLLLVMVILAPGGAAFLGPWRRWLIVCLVLRAVLLQVTPSDDTYRYLWEGRIQGRGYNPFAHTPESAELEHLRDADWRQVTHRDYPTIYPPLAQMLFAATTAVRPSIQAIKFVHVLLDLITVALLAVWSRARGLPPHRALIYGLCPLTLTAFAVDGHLDSLMLLCLVAAGLLCDRGRIYWGAVLLAGAIAAKIVAVVLLGWLAVRSWRAALLCLGCVAAAYLPYVSAGAGLFESLTRFVGTTDFFGLLYAPLSGLVGGNVVRMVGAGLLVAVAAWSIKRRDDYARCGGAVLAAVVIVAPVVHFWYLTWVLLFVALRVRWSWLILAGSMVFYFEAEHLQARTGTWALPEWVWFATYLPFLAAWVIETWRGRRATPAAGRRAPA